MEQDQPQNDKARALISAVLIDGVFLILGVVVFLFTGNLLWLIAGIVLGAVLSVPPLLRFFRGPRA
ncbi:MAG: hypothetical protein AAGG45_05840 [Pseudomonadota bacterium]